MESNVLKKRRSDYSDFSDYSDYSAYAVFIVSTRGFRLGNQWSVVVDVTLYIKNRMLIWTSWANKTRYSQGTILRVMFYPLNKGHTYKNIC